MATVTGYTAERMKEIEDNSIVSGEVDGSGHLILTKFNGDQIDAGPVIGPQGVQGPPLTSINDLGDVDTTGLDVGDVMMWNGTNWVPGTNIKVQGVAPGTPEVGDLWVDTAS